MNYNKSIIQHLLEEMHYIFAPLVSATESPDEAYRFFRNFGWNIDALFDMGDLHLLAKKDTLLRLIGDLEGIANSLQNGLSLQTIPEHLTTVKNTIEEIKLLIESAAKFEPTIAANHLQAAGDILLKLPPDLLNALVVRHLSANRPAIYAFLNAIGIIRRTGKDYLRLPNLADGTQGALVAAIGDQLRIDPEAFNMLFRDPRKSLRKLIEDRYLQNFAFNAIDNLSRADDAAVRIFDEASQFLQGINIESFLAFNNNTIDKGGQRYYLVIYPLIANFQDTEAYAGTLFKISISLIPTGGVEGGPGLNILLGGNARAGLNFDFDPWKLDIELKGEAISGAKITASGVGFYPSNNEVSIPIDASVEAAISLSSKTAGNARIILGKPSETRLQYAEISFNASAKLALGKAPDAGFFIKFREMELAIQADRNDGFLSTIIGSNPISTKFDLEIGWSLHSGLHFGGSGGLDIPLRKNINLGPIELHDSKISVKPSSTGSQQAEPGMISNFGTTLKVKLGPVNVVVENLGLKIHIGFPTDQKGNLGFLNLDLGFKPPTGLSLSLDTPQVKASGGLKIEDGEYIGTLHVEIVPIKLSITAIAIIQTKLPEGGFSLLIILTAEFPPLPLGFGFTLNGLGGLFGYKRGMEVDVLRNGLKNKTLDSILFPKNVKDNVGKVVSDLKSVFPATAEERFLIGPMAKIAWGGSRVTAELGVIIELPDPVRIAILGVVRVILPDENAEMLKLQINFLGTIDFAQKRISLDANLEDSRLLKVMTLTGQFALRIGWGSDPLFIFSAGGFHPDFKQAPVELQKMDRLGIVLIDKPNLKLRAESYFALTTNTLQFGARAFCSAIWGPYSATVTAGFDALIQFKPFHLSAKVFLTGHAILPLGVKVVVEANANLTGPNVWRIWGSVTVFVAIPWGPFPFDVSFGSAVEELTPKPVDVLSLLKQEVKVDGNWSAQTPGSDISPKVTLRQLPAGGGIVLHPNTTLSFNQRLVPLGIDIQKFGDKTPERESRFAIESIAVMGTNLAVDRTNLSALYENFAPGLFFNIPKERQLSLPSFQSFKSGVSFGLGQSEAIKGNEKEKDLGKYERIYIKKKPASKVTSADQSSWKNLGDDHLRMLAGGGAAARSGLSHENNRPSYLAPGKVIINEPAYVVASTKDLANVDEENKTTYRNQAEAYEMQRKLGRQADTIILSTYE